MATETENAPTLRFDEIGTSGLAMTGGFSLEEWNTNLRRAGHCKTYTEMRDNDPVIGAVFLIIEYLLTNQKWRVKKGTGMKARQAKKFVEDCMTDMEHTWQDFIHEALSFLQFGWAYHEIVYKVRDDGKIGWRKLPIRAQSTLWNWETDERNEILGLNQLDMWAANKGPTFIPKSKSVHFTTTPLKGNPEGRSILRSAVRAYKFVLRLQELEAIGIEREMAGLPTMQVPPAMLSTKATPEQVSEVASIKRMLMQLRADERAAVVVPAEEISNSQGVTQKTGYKLEFRAGGGKRAIDTNIVISRYETRIAASLMGQFILLGSGGSGGSYALADAQASVFTDALAAALYRIQEAINKQLIEPLMLLNGYDAQEIPTVEPAKLNDVTLATMATYINQLVAVNVLQPDDELESHLRNMADLPEKGTPRAPPTDPNAMGAGAASDTIPVGKDKQGNDGKSGKDKVNVRTEPAAGTRKPPN